MKNIVLILSIISIVQPVMAQILDAHQWKDRLIVLFAASDEDPELEDQLDVLQREETGVEERDLKIYRIFPESGLRPGGQSLAAGAAKEWRRHYSVGKEEAFVFLLIGKDGTVKLRSEEVVSTDRLFSLIDSMPMRRAEMRRQKNE